MTNIINQKPYLPNSRVFPEDLPQLAFEVNKTYVDIANSMNNRTIGVFPTNSRAITGETWFLNGASQQTLRQVYLITGGGSVPHGLTFDNINYFTRIYGNFTDGSKWYPLPYTDVTAANQISLEVDSTNIVITLGGGAPAITSGIIILEWMGNA